MEKALLESMDYTGRAAVPSGASTGKFEALELRDGDKEIIKALVYKKQWINVNTKISEAILGEKMHWIRPI